MEKNTLPERILVTGGAGFLGSAVLRQLLAHKSIQVLNLDSFSYAANRQTVAQLGGLENYHQVEGDICDPSVLKEVFASFRPSAVLHLAAETHVDRSIADASDFIQTNIVGTYTLLCAARQYWQRLVAAEQSAFRFIHISTDEVYGSLGAEGSFTEDSPYQPRSPYAASKAASDHLAQAWHHTFGLPLILSHSTNNYGPFQHPEKLIPRMIATALAEQPLPIYDLGDNVRDWLYVDDHAEALLVILSRGSCGETYNVGADHQRTNLEVVQSLCTLLDELQPRHTGSYSELISFVADRPGHDFRYAIDASKIRQQLGWQPQVPFEGGLRSTVEWYLENIAWWQSFDD